MYALKRFQKSIELKFNFNASTSLPNLNSITKQPNNNNKNVNLLIANHFKHSLNFWLYDFRFQLVYTD